MKNWFLSFLRAMPEKSDVLLLVGTAMLFYGIFRVFPPAAYGVIGTIFIFIALINSRPRKEGDS